MQTYTVVKLSIEVGKPVKRQLQQFKQEMAVAVKRNSQTWGGSAVGVGRTCGGPSWIGDGASRVLHTVVGTCKALSKLQLLTYCY